MASDIEQAIRQICDEKGLSYESVIDAIEAALAAAYRKDFGENNQNIETDFNPETGDVTVYDVKTVVEDMDLEELEAQEEARKKQAEEFAQQLQEARERGEELPAVTYEEDLGPQFNEKTDIMLRDTTKIKEDAEVGDVLRTELEQPGEFGRMAAMTAKQVITQKLREAEREIVFNEYKQHEGTLINGTVQRREGRLVLVDIGRSVGVLRPDDQIPNERYNPGDRLRVLVRQVSLTPKGPKIELSRAHPDVVRRLFEQEIPEVDEGLVEIKKISREAGSRSKVAVTTDDDQIDPIGACIGQRGTRIQTIIAELSGEKIDIIEWSDDLETFVVNALSPAEINEVEMDEEAETITVYVDEDQLSLAIGRGGQNVRLAARLVGWKINIAEVGGEGEDAETTEAEGDEDATGASDDSLEKEEGQDEETEAPDQETDDTEATETDVDDTEDKKEADDAEATEDESKQEHDVEEDVGEVAEDDASDEGDVAEDDDDAEEADADTDEEENSDEEDED